jgi:predicted nucleic acid-binding protein
MEVRYGIALLPRRKRRSALDLRFREFVDHGFASRVLPFDQAAAYACADIRAFRRHTGNPITIEDAVIAAIARVHGVPVATRDSVVSRGAGSSSSIRGTPEPVRPHGDLDRVQIGGLTDPRPSSGNGA